MTPYKAVHPGKTLKLLILDERNITIEQFAQDTGVEILEMERICKGKQDICDETATQIGDYLGSGKDLWLTLQNRYDEFQNEKKMKSKIVRIMIPSKIQITIEELAEKLGVSVSDVEEIIMFAKEPGTENMVNTIREIVKFDGIIEITFEIKGKQFNCQIKEYAQTQD